MFSVETLKIKLNNEIFKYLCFLDVIQLSKYFGSIYAIYLLEIF